MKTEAMTPSETPDCNRDAPASLAPAAGSGVPFQSQRRTLRNYYAAIFMGLSNPADVDIAKAALDRLICVNEAAILSEEAQSNDEAHARRS